LKLRPANRSNLILFSDALLKAVTGYIVKKPLGPLIWTALP